MADSKTRIETDALGDWRLYFVTTLAADVPSAFPGGPSHKKGAPVIWSMEAMLAGAKVNVGLPSATALSFNIAFRAAERANALKTQLVFTPMVSPPNVAKQGVSTETIFDVLEECMTTVIFSHQAIEAFVNFVISTEVKGTFPIERKDRTGAKVIEQLTADEIERKVSTNEKVATILPVVRQIASFKGKKLWQQFASLGATRDASVHHKRKDQSPKNSVLATDDLYHILLTNDPLEFARTAVRIVDYFQTAKLPPLRWLEHLKEKYSIGA